MATELEYAVLSCEHWDACRIFAAPTLEEAMAKCEAYVRAAVAELGYDEDEIDAYMSGEDGDFPWMWQEAHMDDGA